MLQVDTVVDDVLASSFTASLLSSLVIDNMMGNEFASIDEGGSFEQRG